MGLGQCGDVAAGEHFADFGDVDAETELGDVEHEHFEFIRAALE